MLRRGWLALLPILLWTQSGCLWTAETERSSWVKRFNSQAISPDHALIQVAQIERPVDDDYINRSIWQNADELFIGLERHGVLAENGFRVGQLVGPPSDAFQRMLLSRECCSAPKGMCFPAGRVMPIYLGPVREQMSYKIVLHKAATDVALDLAGFALDVSASFASDGRTKLTFTPTVENGELALPFHPRPDQSTWELRTGRASRKYPGLSWDVTLAPNQYLLIGGRTDRAGTLGAAAFKQADAGVQRMLVIRNCRSVAAQEATDSSIEDLIRTEKSTPIALQATIPASRSKMH